MRLTPVANRGFGKKSRLLTRAKSMLLCQNLETKEAVLQDAVNCKTAFVFLG